MITLRMGGIEEHRAGRDHPRGDRRVTMRTEQPASKPGQSCSSSSKTMIEKGASDLHITTGSPPLLRIDGRSSPKLRALGPVAPRTRSAATRCSPRSRRARSRRTTSSTSRFGVKSLSRFRANIFMQRGAWPAPSARSPSRSARSRSSGCRRSSPSSRNAARAGAGHRADRLGQVDDARGDHRQDQQRAAAHIMTIEDPIEYLHPHKRASSTSARSAPTRRAFKTALKYVLRAGPGRRARRRDARPRDDRGRAHDRETGHLVFATLHTNRAAQTINRIIDVFPRTSSRRSARSSRSCSRA